MMQKKSALRLLMINKLRWPWVGGVERVAEQLFDGLTRDQGLAVTYMHISEKAGAADRQEGPRRRVVELSNTFWSAFGRTLVGRMPWSFAMASQIKARLADHDVVLLHDPFPLGDLACLLAVRHKPLWIFWHSDIRRFPALLLILRPTIEALLRRATGIIVTSPQMLEYSDFLRPHAAKVHVVPLGVDIARFATSDTIDPQSLGQFNVLPEQYVLCVGRLAGYKGYDVFIEALRRLPDHIQCVIVGQGPLEAQLKHQATAAGLDHRLRWAGNCSDEMVVCLMRHCRVFALPSVDEAEAYGIVQVEAMACGRPVVSTRLRSGVPFVNADGISGLTVPPRDPESLAQAIGRLWDDRQLYATLSEGARQRATTLFTQEAMVARVAELLAA